MGAALLTDPEKVYNVSTGVLVAYSTVQCELVVNLFVFCPSTVPKYMYMYMYLPSIIHTVVVTFNLQ